MIPAPLHLAGEKLLLDPSGAVVWPDQRLLAVADLHLEKGAAMARRGQLVPPWDTGATLDRLALVLRRHRPEQLVLLGDSFHDRHGPAAMLPRDAARLRALLEPLAVTWIAGNHDPVAPSALPGSAAPDLQIGPILFRHEADRAAARRPGRGEISGHFHPKARIPTRGGHVARPCFVSDATRLLLPAFGSYTGGLTVDHPAIAGLFPRGGRSFLLGQNRLFSFPLHQLKPDSSAPAVNV